MPIAFPGTGALHNSFSPSNPLTVLQQKTQQPLRTKCEARSELYGAWSVSEDAKAKANQLSDKAVKELDKASAAAQAKTGQIEMYSPKFYAACTLGGLLACVSYFRPILPSDTTKSIVEPASSNSRSTSLYFCQL